MIQAVAAVSARDYGTPLKKLVMIYLANEVDPDGMTDVNHADLAEFCCCTAREIAEAHAELEISGDLISVNGLTKMRDVVPDTIGPGPKRRHREGFVYLMQNAARATKIGFSTDPVYREKTLQSQEPEITLIFSAPGTMKVERDLHERFAKKRIRGEWFDLTISEIEAIKALF